MALPPKMKPDAKPKAKAVKVPPTTRKRRLHVRADLASGGSLHVRHLADDERDVFLDGEAVALADNAPKAVWCQIAKPGVFRGHHAGAFELNEKVFDEIIANFRATENRSIPIDFEHASEAEPTSGSIPVDGAPAQGWIRDLKIQGGNLWGLVEWGQKARDYIKSGAYKFFSPAVRFNARDRVTGKSIGARMTSGALTNNPFLDGMKALAAKDGTTASAPNTPCGDVTATMRLAFAPAEYMPRLRCILGLSELSTAAECGEQLERLREHFAAVGDDPDAAHEGIPLARFVYPLRNLVSASLGDTWDDVFDCASELVSAAVGGVALEDEETAAMTDTTNEAGASAGMSNNQDVSATPDKEDTAMSAEKIAELSTKNAELAVSLKDTTTKLTAAETKASETETKLAEATLSIKEESSKREAAELELKTLRDDKAARETKDLTDRVNLAFETYKDAQKLTEDDKETMLIVLKAKPDSFEKKYPKIAPAQQHLVRNLTDHRTDVTPRTHVDDGHAPTTTVDVADLAIQISRQRGIPLADAQLVAFRLSNAPTPPTPPTR